MKHKKEMEKKFAGAARYVRSSEVENSARASEVLKAYAQFSTPLERTQHTLYHLIKN